jgi:hypothetical protein
VAIDLRRVETNFVSSMLGRWASRPASTTELLLAEGVRVSGTLHPGVLRAVTHLGIGDEDIDHAIESIPRALGAQRSPAMKNAAATTT